MTGQRSMWGRATLGLVTAAAAAVLLAPVASASPDTDANDAITAAWDASGGPTSPLGPQDGGVYPIGDGFGQNFAGGKIFFTPDTGAHIMGGAILDKYMSLGGPADSDLGFPTIDEGPGRVSPDSRNTTFSAGDKPVIFWTPDTGARVVRGAINAAWDKLGGSAGPLGVPAEDETYNGDGVTQAFTGGQLSWNRQTKAFTTTPPELAAQLTGLDVPNDATSAINEARRAAGGPLGPLGAKQGAQYAIGDGGAGQDFAGGKIFFSPATGANVVTGQVLAKYASVGGPQGDLGFPTSNEVDGGLAPASRMSTFAAADKPVIFWTPDYGAVIVRGAMNAAWAKLGGATGTLGAPIADQTESGEVVTQRFSGGDVSWNKTTDKFTTTPPSLAASLAGLRVPGQYLPKSPVTATPNANADKAFTWLWWYWPILIAAALLLAGLLVGALSLGRRRRHSDDMEELPTGGPGAGVATGYGSVAAENWSPDSDIDARGSRFAEHEMEMAGYPSSGWPDPDVRESRESAERWATVASIGGLAARGVSGRESAADDEPIDADEAFYEENPDAVDTAPSRIESDAEMNSGRHAALNVDGLPRVWTPGDGDSSHVPQHLAGGFGAAAAPGETLAESPETGDNRDSPGNSVPGPAIALPLGDPRQAPQGYPVKGNVRSGLYYTPDSVSYGDVDAEIWFSSEDLARANGFAKGE
jgi:uncharacterized protein with LGFP repeats